MDTLIRKYTPKSTPPAPGQQEFMDYQKCTSRVDLTHCLRSVSSIGNYNYELIKYLCSLLQPYIPDNYCTQDSFSFVTEIQGIPLSGNLMVSFDVESLFTNIPLDECIDLAVRYIKEENTDIKLSATEHKPFYVLPQLKLIFLLKGSFYDQVDGVCTGSHIARSYN